MLLCEYLNSGRRRITTDEGKKTFLSLLPLYYGDSLSYFVKECCVYECWFLNVNLFLLNLFHLLHLHLLLTVFRLSKVYKNDDDFFWYIRMGWGKLHRLYLPVKRVETVSKGCNVENDQWTAERIVKLFNPCGGKPFTCTHLQIWNYIWLKQLLKQARGFAVL